jgi:hypothetical protein
MNKFYAGLKEKFNTNKKSILENADWFGGCACAGTILSFIHSEWKLMALPIVVPAILFLPPSYRYLNKKFKLNIKLHFKIIIFIIAWLMMILIGIYHYKI